jgi:hypothetical protein
VSDINPEPTSDQFRDVGVGTADIATVMHDDPKLCQRAEESERKPARQISYKPAPLPRPIMATFVTVVTFVVEP